MTLKRLVLFHKVNVFYKFDEILVKTPGDIVLRSVTGRQAGRQAGRREGRQTDGHEVFIELVVAATCKSVALVPRWPH